MPSDPIDYASPTTPRGGSAALTCPHCGGANTVEGKLAVEGRLRFLPNRVKSFWTFNTGVTARAYACLTCGTVTTTIDPADLRRLVGPGTAGCRAMT